MSTLENMTKQELIYYNEYNSFVNGKKNIAIPGDQEELHFPLNIKREEPNYYVAINSKYLEAMQKEHLNQEMSDVEWKILAKSQFETFRVYKTGSTIAEGKIIGVRKSVAKDNFLPIKQFN